MTPQEKLNQLAVALNGATGFSGLVFSTELMPGEVDVLIVSLEHREELPVYITVDESQILCITHLWTEAEVEPTKKMDLLDALLTLNIPIPLSSFSKIGQQYVIFGALSVNSSSDQLIEEIDTLSDNTLTAIEELSAYLIKK
ncbi:YjfI family protein [Beggiatoa leptomitoformis]|uniref:DUF2170 family protein n=1 Tax=Beggiatoa leptomitoformis TaxID=288004 RepID=A0A2N9YFP6_9GAMM|nr:DUF2170 family protein [Beggiatoa leptomitoformis]ALG68365.1 DUF2170 family protein [Beggiatoa leptomitoformis]AUI69314.1 DUF2170 family protein [Beggiatoa leptomitoformis]